MAYIEYHLASILFIVPQMVLYLDDRKIYLSQTEVLSFRKMFLLCTVKHSLLAGFVKTCHLLVRKPYEL